MSAYFDVLLYIRNEIPLGAVFTAKDLLGVASRSNVDQLLPLFARTRTLRRVSRGVYFRPIRYDSVVRPSLLEIMKVRAEAKGETIHTHGADAAAAFGLADDAPAAPRFYTSGRTRTLRIGGELVRFQHVPNVVLTYPFERAGDALATFHHLGAGAVAAVRARLTYEERERVTAVVPSLPDRVVAAWHAAGEAARSPRRLRVVSRPARTGPGAACRRRVGGSSPPA